MSRSLRWPCHPEPPRPKRVPPSAYLTVTEVAELLRLSEKSVYRLVKAEPTLTALRSGGSVRFPRERFERWLRDPAAVPHLPRLGSGPEDRSRRDHDGLSVSTDWPLQWSSPEAPEFHDVMARVHAAGFKVVAASPSGNSRGAGCAS